MTEVSCQSEDGPNYFFSLHFKRSLVLFKENDRVIDASISTII